MPCNKRGKVTKKNAVKYDNFLHQTVAESEDLNIGLLSPQMFFQTKDSENWKTHKNPNVRKCTKSYLNLFNVVNTFYHVGLFHCFFYSVWIV